MYNIITQIFNIAIYITIILDNIYNINITQIYHYIILYIKSQHPCNHASHKTTKDLLEPSLAPTSHQNLHSLSLFPQLPFTPLFQFGSYHHHSAETASSNMNNKFLLAGS